MNMVDIDTLLPDVLTHAPRAPNPTAYRYIREAVRDVCRKAALWRDTDSIIITDPQSEGLITFTDASIVSIENAKLDGRPLEPKSVKWLDENVEDWTEMEVDAGVAAYVTQLEPNRVTVVPYQTGTLKLRLVLMPSMDAMILPGAVVEQYHEMLARGAAGKLLTLPKGSDYGDVKLGAALMAVFEDDLADMHLDAVRGQHGAPPRTVGSYF